MRAASHTAGFEKLRQTEDVEMQPAHSAGAQSTVSDHNHRRDHDHQHDRDPSQLQDEDSHGHQEHPDSKQKLHWSPDVDSEAHIHAMRKRKQSFDSSHSVALSDQASRAGSAFLPDPVTVEVTAEGEPHASSVKYIDHEMDCLMQLALRAVMQAHSSELT